jgi:hypothetical protein
MLAVEAVEVHVHALKTMTEQFQLCERGHLHLGKLHRCLDITFGTWDLPDSQPVHTLPCNNSAMKGNNVTNRIP